jgi:hypothetical protein
MFFAKCFSFFTITNSEFQKNWLLFNIEHRGNIRYKMPIRNGSSATLSISNQYGFYLHVHFKHIKRKTY